MTQPTLRGITWDHPRGYLPLEAASEIFEKRTGISIHWQRRSLRAFGDQRLDELAQTADLLIVDYPHCGFCESSHAVVAADLSLSRSQWAAVEAQSVPVCFQSFSYHGHLWALPLDAAFQSASYRPDLFSEPLPGNWEEVFRLCGRLRPRAQYVGMALCPTDLMCSFLSLLADHGAPVREGADRCIEWEQARQVLDLLHGMQRSFHPFSMQWNPIALYEYMSRYPDLPYCPLAFNYTNYARPGFSSTCLAFGAPPGRTSILGGAGIAVSASSSWQPQALEFALWVTSGQVQKGIYLDHQGQPAHLEVWSHEKAGPLSENFFAPCWPSLQRAYIRPRHSGWPAFQEWLGERLHQYLAMPGSPIRLVDEINYKFDESKKG